MDTGIVLYNGKNDPAYYNNLVIYVDGYEITSREGSRSSYKKTLEIIDYGYMIAFRSETRVILYNKIADNAHIDRSIVNYIYLLYDNEIYEWSTCLGSGTFAVFSKTSSKNYEYRKVGSKICEPLIMFHMFSSGTIDYSKINHGKKIYSTIVDDPMKIVRGGFNDLCIICPKDV